MANNKDDWEDVPLESESTDDWQDISKESPSFLDKLGQKLGESGQSALESGKSTLQDIADFSSGAVKGASMGSLDELAGVLGAGVETGLGALGIGPSAVDQQLKEQGFQVPEESFLQKYRGYQQASEQAQKEAADRSPWLEGAGQLAGGAASGSVIGGLLGIGKAAQGAKTIAEIAKDQGKARAALELLKRGGQSYLKAAPGIAAESALTSEQQLLGENANPAGVAADVAGGLAFGLPAIIGLEGASQAVMPSVKGKIAGAKQAIGEAFADEGNPRLRQLAKAYTEYGQNLGIHPRSHAAEIAGPKFAQKDEKAASKVLGMLDEADTKLGQDVGQSLEKATARGALLDISPEIDEAAQKVAQIAGELPQIAESMKVNQAYKKILQTKQQLTPIELKNLIDDIDFSISAFGRSTQLRPGETNIVPELNRIRKNLSNVLKEQVPEYRDTASRFESFRQIRDQLVSGARPSDVTEAYYGNIKQGGQKEFDNLLNMIQNTQRDTQSAGQYRTAFTNFMDSLEKFQAQEADRMASNPELKQVLPSANDLRKYILNASDDSVLRGSVRATTDERGFVPNVKEWAFGKAPASMAYLAGKTSKGLKQIGQTPLVEKTANVARAVYNAPDHAVANLASRLEASDKFKNVGKSLKESLENGNTAKKNAALFTIMQNPNARAFISAEDFPDIEE